jgi:membrane protein DedA with SNARE-associated domain
MQRFQEVIVQNLFSLPTVAVNFFIFLLAYIESLPIITIFFPGMMVAVIIGSLTPTGVISPFVAINLIALGSFLGDITSLYAGPQLLKINWFKKFIEKEKYQKHWALFDKNIAWIIILSKVLPFIRSTPSLFAGARNISKTKYFLYTLISSYLWSALAILGGSFLGHIFGKLVIPIIFLIFIFLGLITYFYKKYT